MDLTHGMTNVAARRLRAVRLLHTAVAARYTDDRRANFDIYLPEWLARQNKEIFGPLYAAGVVYLVAMYLQAGSGVAG
jgi:hypothetical protein